MTKIIVNPGFCTLIPDTFLLGGKFLVGCRGFAPYFIVFEGVVDGPSGEEVVGVGKVLNCDSFYWFYGVF